MDKKDIQQLFSNYRDGKCTEKEKAQLEAWYMEFNEHLSDLNEREIEVVKNQLFRELPGNESLFLGVGLKLMAAVLLVGVTTVFVLRAFMPHSARDLTREIVPGSDAATLTLANGKRIELSKASSGKLVLMPGVSIVKNGSGQISYHSTQINDSVTDTSINVIATPNAGQWQVVLSDGTKVWLNSASTLSYPSNFANQKQRKVQLTGEGYFEVTKDKKHPFLVSSGRQLVQVLGTHFNVNAYSDEPDKKTTLAEGSIKISLTGGLPRLLTSGQQAIIKANDLTISEADVEQALAWKNGYFRFNDEPIQSIMRQLARWYNIDVRYEPGISQAGLNGKISRNKNIGQVLNALEATQSVHFKIKGRRITVLK